MAHELEISQAPYPKLENQETKLSVERLFQIAKVLKTPIEDLLNTTPKSVVNQTNHDTATGNQYIENLSQESKEIQQDFILSLKSEIQHLKEQNIKLVEFLMKNEE